MATDEENADQFVKWLEAQPGKKAGNKKARYALNLDEQTYWRARKVVLDRGDAIRGTGKGGSTQLLANSVQSASVMTPIPVVTGAPSNEDGWYTPLHNVLQADWRAERGFDEMVIEITARQGRRNTGGKWTRPDISVVALRRLKFVPDDEFEVWTFEVKRGADVDVTTVYEAVAHARAATHAVVLACYDSKPSLEDELILEQVKREATRHGVGLIVVEWSSMTFDEWDLRVEPIAQPAGMRALNEFITRQLPSRSAEVEGWL